MVPPHPNLRIFMSETLITSFRDLFPAENDLLNDVIFGLSKFQKSLPCKYFYDERGSKLFENICGLPEYYPTRIENALMTEKSAEMADLIGPGALVLEYGCGSMEKVRVLLDALDRPASYIAVDISREQLRKAAEALARDYPELDIHAICADFSQPLEMIAELTVRRKVAFFPGSTIGNFEFEDARNFLSKVAGLVGPGGGLLIGADRKKDRAILRAAYNDKAGITAEFNLNLLARINAELGGNFKLSSFKHDAIYNDQKGRIEMYLVSLHDQLVEIGDRQFSFQTNEKIHTENSHKYDIEEFQEFGWQAGFVGKLVWSDKDDLFSIYYFEVPHL